MFKAGVTFFKAHHFGFFEPLVFGVVFLQNAAPALFDVSFGLRLFLGWMFLGGGFNPFEKH